MANKRSIKKSLALVMDDLFLVTLMSAVNENADKEKATQVQERIIKVYTDFNSRLSNYERKNAKRFFKQFKEEINKELSEIIDEIGQIVPSSQN